MEADDFEFVEQGLLLWESVVSRFEEFVEDLRFFRFKDSERFSDKEKLLDYNRLLDIFQHYPHKYYIALWTLGEIGNKLEKLPKTIGNLQNLAGLNLRENQLTELLECIGDLTNLTKLNV